MTIKVNSVDPDQTAPKEQSDQGLHCLAIVNIKTFLYIQILTTGNSLQKRQNVLE